MRLKQEIIQLNVLTFFIFSYFVNMNRLVNNDIIMSSKENNQDTLIAYLEKEYEQQLNLQAFYEKQLSELKSDKKDTAVAVVKSTPPRNKTVRVKTEEVSIMDESIISIYSQSGSKADKKESKKQGPLFEMQYQLLSKQLAKLIQGIANKDAASFKKTSSNTPRRNSSFTNKSALKPTPQIPEFKMNLSTISVSKTERQNPTSQQRQQLLSQLGDTTSIVSSDEVVMKLVSNLRQEEQRYVDAILFRSKMSAKSKMKNYLEHLCQKNEQTLFKLKQRTIDRSLSRLEYNKEAVKNGYTLRMKDLIQKGLRVKAPAQI